MKAMLLAAGRGERMRPLTDTHPKPLLKVGGKPLIIHLLETLVEAGIREFVVNHAWLGEQIQNDLGNGARFGARILYSPEPPGALETAGGVHKALPLIRDDTFLVVNADLWTDFDFRRLERRASSQIGLAHLVVVPNPPHHPLGDFGLRGESLSPNFAPRYTYSGIGLYHRELFEEIPAPRYPLAPLLKAGMAAKRITGEVHHGVWYDIGSPQRLAKLDREQSEGA